MAHIRNLKHIAEVDFEQPRQILAICLFQDKRLEGSIEKLDAAVAGLIGKVCERDDFKGKIGDSLLLHTNGPLQRILLIGLGERKRFTADRARQAAGSAAFAARKGNLGSISLLAFSSALSAQAVSQAVAEGLVLGSYHFIDFKAQDEGYQSLADGEVLGALDESAFSRGQVIASAACLARDLQNMPSNAATPTRLAEEAERIGKAKNMSCRVFDREEFTRLGMGALAGVARGSNEPPKFIIIEYSGGESGVAPFGLIGKGLTFDAGGISIKPADKMDEMKFDMSGGAAVLGIMSALAELQPPINVIAAIPSTENLLGGSAQKPGDIVKAYNGKTIEILNTDAEGRLILADALAYVADKYKPVAMLDFATLTGAVLVALGHRASGIMGNDADLLDAVKAAADETGERVWELPMWPEYDDDVKSKIADIKNMGEGRIGGTIAGGKFLEAFVDDIPWVHVDIAGTAWQGKDQAYVPSGGSGVAVRLVLQILHKRING